MWQTDWKDEMTPTPNLHNGDSRHSDPRRLHFYCCSMLSLNVIGIDNTPMYFFAGACGIFPVKERVCVKRKTRSSRFKKLWVFLQPRCTCDTFKNSLLFHLKHAYPISCFILPTNFLWGEPIHSMKILSREITITLSGVFSWSIVKCCLPYHVENDPWRKIL